MNTSNLAHGPFTGLKVVDMTVAIQGPHAGAFLGDMGAEVVKVEPPGGELNRYARGPGFDFDMEVMGSQQIAMNRGKKSIALDVHTRLGMSVLQELIKDSDVFITNYRAEALDRMELSYADLSQINPRLVYGRVRTKRRGRWKGDARWRCPSEGRISGCFRPCRRTSNATGSHDRRSFRSDATLFRRDHRPIRSRANRKRSRGKYVSTRRDDVASILGTYPHGNDGSRPLARPYGVYQASDGGSFLLAVAMSDESWDEFLVFGGKAHIAVDSRWDTAAKRIGIRGDGDGVPEVRAEMREAFSSHTTAEWEEFFREHPEIIYERVQDYRELLIDPQAIANSYLVDIPVPNFGTTKVVSNVVHFSETPGAGPQLPPPCLGEHTSEIMLGLGFSEQEVGEVLAPIDSAAAEVIDLVIP